MEDLSKQITLENLKKDSFFLNGLFNGDFCLVLGAGFSQGVKNQTNIPEYDTIPVSNQFIKITKKEFPSNEGQINDFSTAATIWGNNFKNIGSKENLFRKLFLIDEETFESEKLSLYKHILSPTWHRIFTFNFDNVLETIVTLTGQKQKYKILSYPTDKEFEKEHGIAHLHGMVRNNSNIDEIVFFSDTYGLIQEETNNLYLPLLNSLLSGKSLIILGCQFNENIHYQKVLNKLADVGTKIYQFGTVQPMFREATIANLNYNFISCTTVEFLGFLRTNKSLFKNLTSSNENSIATFCEIKDEEDLDKVSKNPLIIENSLLGRFSKTKNDTGWNDIKSQVSIIKNNLLDFSRVSSILFPITGSSGMGKSTLLFKNIDKYLHSNISDKRKIIFVDPEDVYLLKSHLESNEKYLIAIDGLDRKKDEEDLLLKFNIIYDITIDKYLDVKFVFSLYKNSWNAILSNYSRDKKYNFNQIYYELEANNGWELGQIYNSLLNFYKFQMRYLNINWNLVKMTVLAKADNNPSYIRYIFENAQDQKLLDNDFFNNLPGGIVSLNWKNVSEIPASTSKGVMLLLLILSENPIMKLSQNSVRYILGKFHVDEDLEKIANYIWNTFLTNTRCNGYLKGMDVLTQDSITQMLGARNIGISDVYFSTVTQYKDFFSQEYKNLVGKIIEETKFYIYSKNITDPESVWKCIELLLFDSHESTIKFITEIFENHDNSSVSDCWNIIHLKRIIGQNVQKQICQKQFHLVETENSEDNKSKQLHLYHTIKKLVETIYYKDDPYKLHDFATQLRRYNLPAFEESSETFAEIQKTILDWYNRSNEIKEDDLLVYQAIAKFYFDTNNFEKALEFVDKGLAIEQKAFDYKLFSLYNLKIDILLTQAEILNIVGDHTKAKKIFAFSHQLLKECSDIIESRFDHRSLLTEYGNDVNLKNNIRGFYTFYCQFIDRTHGVFTKWTNDELSEALYNLEWAYNYLPTTKDTTFGYAQFIVNNLNRIYSTVEAVKKLNLVSSILLQRYRERREPKIKDAIARLLKCAKNSQIELSLGNHLRILLAENTHNPHIRRNTTNIINRLENKPSYDITTSEKELLDKLQNAPLNHNTAQNIIRSVLLSYRNDIIQGNIISDSKKEYLAKIIGLNSHYMAYFILTYHHLISNMGFKDYVSYSEELLEFFPNKLKENESKKIGLKYKDWFDATYNNLNKDEQDNSFLLLDIVAKWQKSLPAKKYFKNSYKLKAKARQ